MRLLTLLLALCLLAPRAGAQTATDSAALDSLRTEVIRLRGFLRAAETQATKTLDQLDSIKARRGKKPPKDTAVVPAPPDTTTPPDSAIVVPPDTAPPVVRDSLPPDPARFAGAAELPRDSVSVAWPELSGSVHRVPAGGDVQAAVDAATCGDVVELQADATYVGTVTLRNKDCAGWIVLRSGGSLPLVGTRVTPYDAPQLARLVASHRTQPVIRTDIGAHHWRLVGLEVTSDTGGIGYSLVDLGLSSSTLQNTRESQAHHLVLDRMLIRGHPDLDFQRCVALNSAHTAIVDSWISDCHGKGKDSQAIGGWNGTGPYRIENNYLAGAGENLMLGGADPKIPGALPEDVTIRRNHFHKPLAWQGRWTVKNLFELKIGRRVLVEGNVFENNWTDAQNGFAVVLKSTNQSGGAPWSETADVVLRWNVLTNTPHAVSLHHAPERYPVVPMSRVSLVENEWHSTDRGIQTAAVADLTITGNVVTGGHTGLLLTTDGTQRLVVRGTWFGASTYGVAGNGSGFGTAALDARAPGWIFEGNTVVGIGSRPYPPGNDYPAAADPPRLAPARAATAGVVVGF